MRPISSAAFGPTGPRIIFHTGREIVEGYIHRQTGATAYRVTADGETFYNVRLAKNLPSINALQPGQATMIVTPFNSDPEFVELWRHNCLTNVGSHRWVMGEAAPGFARLTAHTDDSSLNPSWWSVNQYMVLNFWSGAYVIDNAELTTADILTAADQGMIDGSLNILADDPAVIPSQRVRAAFGGCADLIARLDFDITGAQALLLHLGASAGTLDILIGDMGDGTQGVSLTLTPRGGPGTTLTQAFTSPDVLHKLAVRLSGTHLALSVDGQAAATSETATSLATPTEVSLGALPGQVATNDLVVHQVTLYRTASDADLATFSSLLV